LLGPVVAAAAAELVHVLVIVAGVIAGAGAVCVGDSWPGGGGAHGRTRPAPRPASHEGGAGRPPLPKVRQAPELPAAPGRELPGGLQLHFHGVSAQDVAAIVRSRDGPSGNDRGHQYDPQTFESPLSLRRHDGRE
jgi:hypothetical protein